MKAGTIAVIALVGVLGFVLWDKYKNKKKCNCNKSDNAGNSTGTPGILPEPMPPIKQDFMVQNISQAEDSVLSGAVVVVDYPAPMNNSTDIAFAGAYVP
jgi:hypothetical protein